jgi:hypothetical protein
VFQTSTTTHVPIEVIAPDRDTRAVVFKCLLDFIDRVSCDRANSATLRPIPAEPRNAAENDI